MEEIFSKYVEQPEIDGRRFKISLEAFQKLPTQQFKVRHDPSNKTWWCQRGERSRQYYLYVTDWVHFVETLGIGEAGSRISLHEEVDHSSPDAPSSYVFKD
ncbi:hypothetical protein SLE2022_040240 [Rubroshorea leprosula]